MDPRRLLIPAVAAVLASGCAALRSGTEGPAATAPAAVLARPIAASPRVEVAAPSLPERRVQAVEADTVVGGVQVFAWSPGRVFEVRAAPLRVTTLAMGPGETLAGKAAGDTVRWRIGEVVSGTDADRRTYVLLKPLERGLETNLVLTTDRRVYLIDLKSGPTETAHVAVAWDAGFVEAKAEPTASAASGVAATGPVAASGAPNARYRIEPRAPRPRWTPVAVFDDGMRTFIAFGPDLMVQAAPVLFVMAPDGTAQMTNYRQADGLYVVDRLFDRAELRLGDRRPEIVRIRRLEGDDR